MPTRTFHDWLLKDSHVYIYICGWDINWVKGFKRKTNGNGDGEQKKKWDDRPETRDLRPETRDLRPETWDLIVTIKMNPKYEKVVFYTSGDVPSTKMNHFSTRNPISRVPKAQRHKKWTFSLHRSDWTSWENQDSILCIKLALKSK